MRLVELELPDNSQSLVDILHSRGWKEIGAGYHATVYSKPNVNYVIKIFEQDSAYLAFLDLIKRHPNPHFPKIIGKLRIGDQWGKKTYRAVRMEKLEPLSRVEVGDYYVNISGIFAAYLLDRTDHKLNSVQERNLEIAQIYLKDKPSLIEALNLVADELLNRYSLDIGNDVMKRRDGTPVIIDPIDR